MKKKIVLAVSGLLLIMQSFLSIKAEEFSDGFCLEKEAQELFDDGQEEEDILINDDFSINISDTKQPLLRNSGYGVKLEGGSCGATSDDNLMWSVYDSNDDGLGEVLVIEGYGDMFSYEPWYSTPWYSKYCRTLEKVIVSDGVTSISKYAFEDCIYIKQIALPNSVQKIGTGAFWGCESLESIEIPNGISRIYEHTFSDCSSLKQFIIPSSVTKIENSSFADCVSLESIVIPKNVTSMGMYTFIGCENLRSVKILGDIAAIDQYAFYECKNLETVSLDGNIQSIQYRAFGECDSLEEIIIPMTVELIREEAFFDCNNLKKIMFLNRNCRIVDDADAISRSAIIYGYKNSMAEQYAKRYNRNFEELICDHKWNEESLIINNATCTESGIKITSCTICQEIKNEVIPAEGHSWDGGKITEQPTCTKTGTKVYTCTSCKETKQETLNVLDHIWNSDYTIDEEATCTTTGRKSIHCSVCNEVKDGIIEIILLKDHQWGEWEKVSDATVFKPESQKISCTVCGTEETRFIGDKITPTIKLNVTSLTLKVGQSTNVVKVSGLAYGDFVKSWKSSNTKIVKVDSNGKITAQKVAGKATITVTLASKKKAKITVHVQKSVVKTRKITGLKSKLTMKKGQKVTLKPIRNPITATEKIAYTSSNTKVVSVTSKGVVQAKAAGTAKITVKSGTAKFIVSISVSKTKTTAISNVKKSVIIKKGKTYTLRPKRTPSDSDEKITYMSSNKRIATVNSKGVIKGIRRGKAVITVKSGSKFVKCTVTVK